MSRKLTWSPQAQIDLYAQIEYIRGDSPQGARLVYDRVTEAANLLAAIPLGKVNLTLDVFQMAVKKTSLVLTYELNSDEEITILRILHTASNWQSAGWPIE